MLQPWCCPSCSSSAPPLLLPCVVAGISGVICFRCFRYGRWPAGAQHPPGHPETQLPVESGHEHLTGRPGAAGRPGQGEAPPSGHSWYHAGFRMSQCCVTLSIVVMSVKVKGVCDVYGGLLPFSLGSEFSLRFLTLNSEIKVRTPKK